MSEVAESPLPYRVSYSQAARDALSKLAEKAQRRGRGSEFLAAIKELDRRLKIYPQFGEPIIALRAEQGNVWIACVPPVLSVAQFSTRSVSWSSPPHLCWLGKSAPSRFLWIKGDGE
jgi:hypothetical protein